MCTLNVQVDDACASSSKFLSLHHSTTLDWALGFAAMAASPLVGRVLLLLSANWPPLVFDTIIPLAILFTVFRLVSSLPAYLSRRTKAQEDRHDHPDGPRLPTSPASRQAVADRALLLA